MTSHYRVPTIGVEEEYQLVDVIDGGLIPIGGSVLRVAHDLVDADIQHELHLEQIEMASPILDSSQRVLQCLVETRQKLADSARQFGAKLVAAGTHPMHMCSSAHITPGERYHAMEERFQLLVRELMIFGCHVHVHMPDRELAVGVCNRMRRWLPLLQAMTANSPFWDGKDTGYASYRRELWTQWPMTGVPSCFQDFDDYAECVQDLVNCGIIDDATNIYWDLRLPDKVPTIEVRVCDVVTDTRHAVALTAVIRALVMQCELEALAGQSYVNARSELVRGAMWHAARFGLKDTLIDLRTRQRVSASEQLDELLDYIDQPLKVLGDRERVESYIDDLKRDGSPAERQRRYFGSFDGDFHDVVAQLAEDTLA